MQTGQLIPIQAIAAQLGVHPQTLRRWERQGKMPQPNRTLGNHRRYHLTTKLV